jgi:signal transduction histidine kinase
MLVNIDLANSLVFNDQSRVRQILINLLSNAIKFTESGSISVEVIESSKNRLTITIRDTGIGISSQDYQHIFEAFRQIDQGTSRKYPGTALGLAITDSLVQMMGGKISLDSQLGAGSVFKIELPRQVTLVPDYNTGGNYHHNLDGNMGFYYSAQNPLDFPFQSHKSAREYPI